MGRSLLELGGNNAMIVDESADPRSRFRRSCSARSARAASAAPAHSRPCGDLGRAGEADQPPRDDRLRELGARVVEQEEQIGKPEADSASLQIFIVAIADSTFGDGFQIEMSPQLTAMNAFRPHGNRKIERRDDADRGDRDADPPAVQHAALAGRENRSSPALRRRPRVLCVSATSEAERVICLRSLRRAYHRRAARRLRSSRSRSRS